MYMFSRRGVPAMFCHAMRLVEASYADLFATSKTVLSADGASDIRPCEANYSPGSQVSAPNGELIGQFAGGDRIGRDGQPRSQVTSIQRVACDTAERWLRTPRSKNARLSRHGAGEPGEKLWDGLPNCLATAWKHLPTQHLWIVIITL